MKKDNRSIKNRLLEIGEKEYNFGRIGLFVILPATLALIVILLLCHFATGGNFNTFIDAFRFDFIMLESVQAIVVFTCYVGIILSPISVCLYYHGLHYLGLGQIVANTEKQ